MKAAGDVELQDPTNDNTFNPPPSRLSFAQIAKLRMKASELALNARVNTALKDSTPLCHSSSSTSPHITRSLVALSDSIHLVILPLLLISFLVFVILLVQGREVLVPFVIALFFTYLLRPVVNFLTLPYSKCHRLFCTHLGTPYQPSNGGVGLGKNENEGEEEEEEEDEETGLLTLKRKLKRDDINNMVGGDDFDFDGTDSIFRDDDEQVVCSRNRLPRPIAVLIVMVLAVSILGFGVLLVTDAVQGFERDDLLLYQHEGSLLLNQTLIWVKESFNTDGSYLYQRVAEQVGVIDIFRAIVVFCVDATVNIFWVMLFVLYLLYEQNRGSSPNSPNSTSRLRQEIDDQIQRYLTLKLLISAVVGGCVWLLLGPILRVRMSHLFALFTFILNFIPNAGPLVATLLPLPVVILDPSLMPVSKVLSIVGPVFIHAVVGNVVEPQVFGASLELHPVTVLLALAFWYLVWGSAGAILSVPITASLRIVLLHQSGRYSRSCLALLDGRLFEAFEGTPITMASGKNKEEKEECR